MKNASLITNVILGAAVIVLFVLHFTSTSKSASPGETTGTEAAVSGDIVFIQIDSLISQYDMFNDLKSEFENKAQTIQNDLNKRGRSLENDLKDFQTKVQKGLITRSQAEAQQQQLAQRDQELQGYVQQKQMEMSEEEAVLYRRVFDALDTYLKKLNEDKKYSLIISTSGSPSTILYGDKALDITQLVVSGMNDEYIKTKSTK
ncbi:MAG: OmpH family outer membrane protein [Bacteroidia bacterium]|jgi:outer membrane protein|nr:OmpH family outer membrane protein [Bacteroidales bacterium]MDD3299549.1 OmpH family outer membrane protein [Bacteroidales bacterium]MDD3843889.1 OmpH family outer membrane protein [Bacteroidales bacterium]MDD4618157.1 OmpH family outer membrane protein [Bacteroidales bacterium]NCC46694.1 OmpH family outer membrane protein [Bacteroidia bacterium]